VCPEVRMRWNSFDSVCIAALYKALPTIKSLCEVMVRRAPKLEIKDVATGVFSITSKDNVPIQWRTVCAGEPESISSTVGRAEIKVSEGCTVYGPDVSYTSLASTIEVHRELQLVRQEDHFPSSLRWLSGWQEVEEVLDHHEIEDYVEASRIADLDSKRTLATLHQHVGLGTSVGLGTAAAVAFVTVVIGILLGALFFRFRRMRAAQRLAVGRIDECVTAQQALDERVVPLTIAVNTRTGRRRSRLATAGSIASVDSPV